MELVSVIIPNYQHARYLQKRIESVLNQNYSELEIIILDDHSSDDSWSIIEKYQDSRIKCKIRNTSNSGSTYIQWVKGIKECNGSYIWIAESDDYCSAKFIEELLPSILNYPNTALVYCDSAIINNSDEVIGSWSERRNTKFRTNRWSSDFTATGTDEIEQYLMSGTTINNASCVLINRNFIQQERLNELSRFKYLGDWFLYISLLQKGDIHYKSKSLSYYREHDMNITKSAYKKGTQFEELLLAAKMLKLNLRSDSINYFNFKLKEALDHIEKNKVLWLMKLFTKYPNLLRKLISNYYGRFTNK